MSRRPSYALAQERHDLAERLAACAVASSGDWRRAQRAWALHRRAYLSHLDRYLAWSRQATIAERVDEPRAYRAARAIDNAA